MPLPPNFDVLIIGAGQGAALGRMLSEGGQRVALIEKEAVGGTCVNRGCTPTKAHISAAKRAHDARTAGVMGVHVSGVEVDLKKVVAHTQAIVADFRGGVQKTLESLENLELIFGRARFTDFQTVEVQQKSGGVRLLSAPKIVIATGTRSATPPLTGLEGIEWLDNRSLLQLETIPPRLLVLGGGYIACEFAQMFQRFGSEVVVAQSGPQLLEKEDAEVAGGIAEILRAEGLQILLDSRAIRVEKTAMGLRCHFENGATVEATHLLLATGQTPNTDDLGLENTAVKLSKKGHIETDDYLNAAPGIWALGDVKGGPAFTHISYDDARILTDILSGRQGRSIKDRPIPYCVFTDPQLGRVGLSEKEAREQGFEVRIAHLPCSETARGIESGEDKGFLKAVVDANTDQILGGAFLCRDGGEIIAVLQMAMAGKMPYTALKEGIFAHPTFAESLNNLFLAMERAEKQTEEEGCIKTSSL